MSTKHSNLDMRSRAVQSILEGQSIESVSKVLKVNRSTVHRWLKRYNQTHSISGLETKARSGRPTVWNNKEQKALLKDILKPASKFGFETDFWTCRRLIQHAKRTFNIQISQPTLWRYLRKAMLSYQKPEKAYQEADRVVQKKWLEMELPKIKKRTKHLRAILYFKDEASAQLVPVLAKTCAPKGQTPVQTVTGNRGSIAAISALSLDGRLIFNLHRGRFSSGDMIHFLNEMLKHHSRRHLIVVMDQAKPHTSKVTKAFIASQKRLHVFYLPSRSA